MADLDISALVESMLAAAAGVLKNKGPAVATFAQTEFQKIAQTVASIAGQLASIPPEITQDQAVILLDMQENASLAVIASAEGMALIVAEQAINAALGAVKDVVNAFVHFPLIV